MSRKRLGTHTQSEELTLLRIQLGVGYNYPGKELIEQVEGSIRNRETQFFFMTPSDRWLGINHSFFYRKQLKPKGGEE